MTKILYLFAVILAAFTSNYVSAFSSSSVFAGNRLSVSSNFKTRSNSQLNMFFGPKDDGSPGDYVCLDCGYVFTKGPQAWAALPGSYSCPPCGSIKRRFKKVPKGSVKDPTKGAAKKKGGWFG